MSMTPTTDIEPIREGLARELWAKRNEQFPPELRFDFDNYDAGSPAVAACYREADACLTYLIKRQAFLYDVYERIIEEKGLGK